jgi:hypothetical protein
LLFALKKMKNELPEAVEKLVQALYAPPKSLWQQFDLRESSVELIHKLELTEDPMVIPICCRSCFPPIKK